MIIELLYTYYSVYSSEEGEALGDGQEEVRVGGWAWEEVLLVLQEVRY